MKSTDINIHVCFSADDRYAPTLIVAMQSLIECTSTANHYFLYILSDGISKLHQAILLGMCKENIDVIILETDIYKEKIKDFFIDRHLSLATYYRFFLPELFPRLEKILYLDTDIIIKDDIATLYAMDISGNYIAGCCDIAVNTLSCGDFGRSHSVLKHLGYVSTGEYVNAGILLFNLNKMREMDATSRLLRVASATQFPFHDQDVLNLVFQGYIQQIDERWNFITHLTPEMYSKDIQESLHTRIRNNDIAIIHYPGARKPWNDTSIPLGGFWWAVALRSPAASHFLGRIPIIIPQEYSGTDCKRTSKVKREFYRVMKNITFGKVRDFYKEKLRKYYS